MIEPTDRLFRQLIEERSGLQTPDYRLPELERLVKEISAATGIKNFSELYGFLSSPGGKPHLTRLIEGMTVGETYFFRHEAQFRLLKQTILPDIIRQRQTTHTLRIWSAACSGGEEAYSLAILLHQLLPDLPRWSISLLGTDINSNNLARARNAQYRAWSMRQVADEIRAAYFTPVADNFQLRPDIQRMVTFQQHNLVELASPTVAGRRGDFDLILCRNVLIYFSEATNARIVQYLHNNSANDGWLLAGHAEPLQLFNKTFQPHAYEGTTAYRPRKTVPVHSERIEISAVAMPYPAAIPYKPSPPATPATPSGWEANAPPAPDIQALAHWNKGDVDGALCILKSILPASVKEGKIGYQIARIYAHRSLWDRALVWLESTLQRELLFAPAHYLQGIIHFEMGDDAKALAAFRKTLYADPHYVLAFVSQATVLEKMGDSGRADKALGNAERWAQGRDDNEQITPEEEITVGDLRNLLASKKLGSKTRNAAR